MTVLAAVQGAAPWIGITVPTALFTGTDRTSVEMQAMVNEAALGIAEDFDWQRLKVLETITGDATTTAWPLPDDYARMLKQARLWPSAQPNTPLRHVVDTDEWLGIDTQNMSEIVSRWTIYGNDLHIKPAVASAATVKFFYISNLIVLATGGTDPTKDAFDTDSDEFFLGDRILKLAIIWRWKAAKGRPYAEDFANYQNARDQLAGNDKGPRILRVGTPRVPSDVHIAYPGTITG